MLPDFWEKIITAIENIIIALVRNGYI